MAGKERGAKRRPGIRERSGADDRGAREIIRLENVSKIYDSGVVAVQALLDIDLIIRAGDYIAIMGPSGSGKSTLMHIIGCLDLPTSGEYFFHGGEISDFSSDRLARIRSREIGFVFQNFNLLPRLSARENVELPLLYAKVSTEEREEIVARTLEKVGLTDRAEHKPNELSGGQMQRVAIARALANGPALILADEPTGNLDSVTGEEIMELLGELNRQGTTLVLVTHDSEVAAKASTHIKLYDGRIA